MSLHMITTFETADFEAWREVFRREREELSHVGLHPRHVMHEADHPTRVWILFEVEDRKRAETWIEADAAMGQDRSGIKKQTHTFLDPV